MHKKIYSETPWCDRSVLIEVSGIDTSGSEDIFFESLPRPLAFRYIQGPCGIHAQVMVMEQYKHLVIQHYEGSNEISNTAAENN